MLMGLNFKLLLGSVAVMLALTSWALLERNWRLADKNERADAVIETLEVNEEISQDVLVKREAGKEAIIKELRGKLNRLERINDEENCLDAGLPDDVKRLRSEVE